VSWPPGPAIYETAHVKAAPPKSPSDEKSLS